MVYYDFFCLRYFLVPFKDSLLPLQHPKEKDRSAIVTNYMLSNIEVESDQQNRFVVRIIETKGDTTYGKLSKVTEIERHEKKPSDIEEVKEIDYPFSNFICDRTKQIIVFERKSGVVTKIENISINFAKAINSKLQSTGFEISFEPIVRENAFWKIIDSHEKVYSVSFNLQSPNIFGSKSSANESLKELQAIYNNNKTNFTIVNSHGELNVPKNKIDTYREYSDNGGGNWAVTVEKNGIKKRIKSTDRSVKISIELSDENTKEALDLALQRFLKELTL